MRARLLVCASRSHSLALTVEQHQGLLERQGVPDLHLAVRPIEHVGRQEEDEGRRPLDALQHALLGQVGRAVVVPHLRADESREQGHADG